MASTRLEWETTIKRLAALLSAGAALVSILSFIVGRRYAPISSASAGVPAAEVDRLELLPASDTALSLGDTIHFTAIAADARGLALAAARIQWLSDDSSVALPDSAGRFVARRPGVTGVTVAVGGRAARARIVVQPRPVALALTGDSVIRIPEGSTLSLRAEVRDARGNVIPSTGIAWTAADREVAVADSTGQIRAVAAGKTMVTAALSGLLVQHRVEVLPVPASITLSGGAAQRVAAGERLPAPVAVQVVSRSGRPVPGALVRFDASAAAGRATPDSVATDSNGLARAAWTLGPRPGRQRLQIEVPGIDSPLAVTAEAEPVPGATRVSFGPDTLRGPVLGTLGSEVTVQVSDTAGVALADVPVAWSALEGGTLVALSTRTDSLGMARAKWTLGARAGKQHARVQVGNPRTIPLRTLTATAEPGPASRLELATGRDQRGVAGNPLPHPVVLLVTDSLGNPVEDVPVRIHPSANGTTDTLVTSGPDGRVAVRWSLGPAVGPARLSARLPGRRDSVVVGALALPGPAAKVEFLSPPTAGTAGRPLSHALRIRVTDRNGNPVSGVPVSFTPGAGRLSSVKGRTDTVGLTETSWTLGGKAGRQALVATVKGAGKATLTVQAAPPPLKKAAAPVKKPVTPPPPAPAAKPKRESAQSPFGTPMR